MKNKILQVKKTYIVFQKNGLAALISMVLVAAILAVLVLSLPLLEFESASLEEAHELSYEAQFLADTCFDEALLRLKTNPDFADGSLSMSNGFCTMSVGVSGGGKILTVHGETNSPQYSRDIEASFNLISDLGSYKIDSLIYRFP